MGGATGRTGAAPGRTGPEPDAAGINGRAGSSALLEIRNLSMTFPGRRSVAGRRGPDVRAVVDATLHVGEGETVGLVGESGSGKTTIGKGILGFVRATEGTIRLGEHDVTGFGRKVPKAYRRQVQVVFQDPVASLNPSIIVGDLIGEPLKLHFGMGANERRKRVIELLQQVGLAAHHLERYPYEFSGGQRQRIAVARALASEPRLIVLDEPVSALDVSTQSQVINLLEKLQSETGVAYLLIAHDLAVVRHVSKRICVMYRSRIVEEGPADRVCDDAAHPYTELLLASIPDADPVRQRAQRQRRQALSVGQAAVTGETPVQGCPFSNRCRYVMDVCKEHFPDWTPVAGGGQVACHLHTSGPRLAGRPLSTMAAESISS
jgi:oligopeptide/dipeptide ABC transporter ATP-binding protein